MPRATDAQLDLAQIGFTGALDLLASKESTITEGKKALLQGAVMYVTGVLDGLDFARSLKHPQQFTKMFGQGMAHNYTKMTPEGKAQVDAFMAEVLKGRN